MIRDEIANIIFKAMRLARNRSEEWWMAQGADGEDSTSTPIYAITIIKKLCGEIEKMGLSDGEIWEACQNADLLNEYEGLSRVEFSYAYFTKQAQLQKILTKLKEGINE